MSLFLHITIDLLCAIMTAAGFIAFHINVRQPSTAIKIAGAILIVSGAVGWVGNTYFGLHYMRDGYFDTPVMHQGNPLPMRDPD